MFKKNDTIKIILSLSFLNSILIKIVILKVGDNKVYIKKTACFIIYQYIYGNQKINENFTEIINYIQHYNITINKKELILSGRLCKDIKLGDVLFTENSNKTIIVKGLFAYGNTFDLLNAGMTCVILTNMVEHAFFQYEILYTLYSKCTTKQ